MKTVKTAGKNVFPKILKTRILYIPTNTDLFVHIMYINSSKIFKYLGRFKKGG